MTRSDLARAARSGLAAASLINVAMMPTWQQILDPEHATAMGLRPTSDVYWAAVTVCALVFLGGALVSEWIRRKYSTASRNAATVILLGLCVPAVSAIVLSAGPELSSSSIRNVRYWGGVLFGGSLLLVMLRPRVARQLSHWLYRFFLIVSPFLLVNVVRASIIPLRTDFLSLDSTVPSQGLVDARPGMRVVILIFDDMDFGFTYSSRPSTLVLPTLDSLRRHAFFATDAHSPGTHTSLSIPSYLVGHTDSTISTSVLGQLTRAHRNPKTRDIYKDSTLFDDAFRLGARSEIVGFYIPYCHLSFASRLERCMWRAFPRGGIGGNSIGFPRRVLRLFLNAFTFTGNRAAFINTISSLSTAAVRAVSDSTLRLVYIHLPVPHMPSVWDAGTGQFTSLSFRQSGYFDNLDLADHLLARFADALRQAGLTDRTVLIVTSDHPHHGAIDGIASTNKVPFVVSFPDGVGLEWASRFETIRLRSLVRVLLGGEIRSAAELAEWTAHEHASRSAKPVLPAPRRSVPTRSSTESMVTPKHR